MNVLEVNKAVTSNQTMDIQDLFMKSTLDSIFKVAFGMESNSTCGSSEEEAKFSNAFDEASAMTLNQQLQIAGIQFMWGNTILSIRKVKSGDKGLGSILAYGNIFYEASALIRQVPCTGLVIVDEASTLHWKSFDWLVDETSALHWK